MTVRVQDIKGRSTMTEIPIEKLRELAAYSGDPWTPENPYFTHAEAYMEELWMGSCSPS